MGKPTWITGALLLAALPASAQVTSAWRTARDVPVAVVQFVGGDVEHLAAVVPPGAAAPAALAGFPIEVRPRPGAQLWTVTVPALLAPQAVGELAHAIASGAGSVVALGPLPLRDLQDAFAGLDGVPSWAPPRGACVLADGGLEVMQGDKDRIAVAYALPPVDDPRTDLVPALLALVRTDLGQTFPGAEADAVLQDGCPRLVVRLDAGDEHPRALLRRLRQRVAALAAAPPTADEVARALAACQAHAVAAAVGGGPVARDLAERLALGGEVAGMLAVPAVDGATLGELAREILGGRAGFATVWEREQRPRDEARQTLDNGAVVQVRWVPGEVGVVALALGNIAPRAGREVAAATAAAAERRGWAANEYDFAGVTGVAVAVPTAAITDVLERMSEAATAVRPAAHDDLEAVVMRGLGLTDVPAAEAFSIALALPADIELGGEAVGKFFGSIPSARVTTGVAGGQPGLNWTVTGEAPQLTAVVDLPPTVDGLVAGQVLRDRLAQHSAITSALLAPPGRLVLTVGGSGGAHVPALDASLGATWRSVLRPASAGEVATAARELLAVFYGDSAEAAARRAAAVFLPVVPAEPELLAAGPPEVGKVLAALPAWDALTRYARGIAPPEKPVKPVVRKSRPPRG
jgi:hypothetical protein